jgi:hypothetical protein
MGGPYFVVPLLLVEVINIMRAFSEKSRPAFIYLSVDRFQ